MEDQARLAFAKCQDLKNKKNKNTIFNVLSIQINLRQLVHSEQFKDSAVWKKHIFLNYMTISTTVLTWVQTAV